MIEIEQSQEEKNTIGALSSADPFMQFKPASDVPIWYIKKQDKNGKIRYYEDWDLQLKYGNYPGRQVTVINLKEQKNK